MAATEALRLFCTPMMKSAVKEKEVFLNGEKLEFLLNGKAVKGFRCNHPQQLKVLILHGFSSNAHNFYHFVAPLMEKNYEVIAFDAPAHGASEGKEVNAVDYSEMILELNKRFGPVNAYISHSFGGIALSLALEKIPNDVSTKVVFIAPATETETAINGAFDLLGIRNPGIRKEFDQLILEQSGRPVNWFSIRRAMNNIRATVLWVHDEDDDITPLKDALKVKEDGHSNIRFLITKGLGHRKIYRDEKVVQSIIEFL